MDLKRARRRTVTNSPRSHWSSLTASFTGTLDPSALMTYACCTLGYCVLLWFPQITTFFTCCGMMRSRWASCAAARF